MGDTKIILLDKGSSMIYMSTGFYMPAVTSLLSHFVEKLEKSYYSAFVVAGQYAG